jgi:uncharacterized membrane protein YgdD (TMEM256/DUF423 family)
VTGAFAALHDERTIRELRVSQFETGAQYVFREATQVLWLDVTVIDHGSRYRATALRDTNVGFERHSTPDTVSAPLT